jgi:hypothetical protein
MRILSNPLSALLTGACLTAWNPAASQDGTQVTLVNRSGCPVRVTPSLPQDHHLFTGRASLWAGLNGGEPRMLATPDGQVLEPDGNLCLEDGDRAAFILIFEPLRLPLPDLEAMGGPQALQTATAQFHLRVSPQGRPGSLVLGYQAMESRAAGEEPLREGLLQVVTGSEGPGPSRGAVFQNGAEPGRLVLTGWQERTQPVPPFQGQGETLDPLP